MLPCREQRRASFIFLGRTALSRASFFFDHSPLALDPPAITAELAAPSDDAMTRDHYGDAIAGARTGDCTGGFGRSNRQCDLAVGARLAEWNFLKRLVHLPLKR